MTEANDQWYLNDLSDERIGTSDDFLPERTLPDKNRRNGERERGREGVRRERRERVRRERERRESQVGQSMTSVVLFSHCVTLLLLIHRQKLP